MKALRLHGSHRLVLAPLVLMGLMGCGGTDRPGPLEPATTDDMANTRADEDAGADAGSCPKPDAGRIQVVRRGCPVMLEIGIQ